MKRIASILFLLLTLNGAQAQSYQLHSVFVYSFTRYVQWPEDMNKGDFEIQVLGDSPIIPELQKMAELKKVGDRVIKVQKIQSLAEIKKCNILFVPAEKSAQLDEIISRIGATSTLIVTEKPGLGTKGSAINLIVKDGKLAFEINQSVLNKQRLKASTELTRLAIVI